MLRGFLLGSFALIALQVVLTRSDSLASGTSALGKGIAWLMSPDTPGIPDRSRTPAGSTGGGSSSGGQPAGNSIGYA